MFGLFGGKKPESPQTFSDYLQQRAQHSNGLQNQMVAGHQHSLGGGYLPAAGLTAISTSQHNVFSNHQEVHVHSNLDFTTVKRCLVILTDYVDSLLEKQLNSEFVTVATEEKKIPDLRYLIKYLKGVIDDASNHWSVQQQQAIHRHQIAQAQAAAQYQNQYATHIVQPKPNPPTTGSGVNHPVACDPHFIYDSSGWTG